MEMAEAPLVLLRADGFVLADLILVQVYVKIFVEMALLPTQTLTILFVMMGMFLVEMDAAAHEESKSAMCETTAL